MMSDHSTNSPIPPVPDDADQGNLYLIRILAAVIDAGDPFARGRSQRVLRYCRAMADELGFEADALRNLEIAALLRTLGRTAIERDVLLKPGGLTDAERAHVQTHPEVGYQILSQVPGLEGAAELVRAHQEQPDGSGYPRGLSEAEIPLGSQVLMVASAYDALTSDRPYRAGLRSEDAITELDRCAGSQFSAQVVTAFKTAISRGIEISDDEHPLDVAERKAADKLDPAVYRQASAQNLEIELPDDFEFPSAGELNERASDAA